MTRKKIEFHSSFFTLGKKCKHSLPSLKKNVLMSAAFVLAAVSSALAQGNGLSGITDATNMVTSYFDPATKLIYAVGAVVGLIGGVKVYGKFVRHEVA